MPRTKPSTATPRHLRALLVVLSTAALTTGCAGLGTGTAPPPGLEFPGETRNETVVRAVDGDTFELSESGIVRLIGVNSPESVKPGVPVECHGKEASVSAGRLTGKTVKIELDEVAGERDRYGRKLVYLWYLDDGRWYHYNLEAIENGDARAYAYDDQVYNHRESFEAAEADARARSLGLWSCPS
jgi:micrococcal nuclease